MLFITDKNNVTDIKQKLNVFELETFNIQVHNQMEQFVAIFKKGETDVHPFSNFFLDTFAGFSLLNASYHTKMNFYGTYIIRFLNFVFNDSKNKIDNIEELTIDHASEFLSAFSMGTLPQDKNGEWRSPETVTRADHAITHFMYWLWSGKNRQTKKKYFKMKYLKKEDFTIKEISKKSYNKTYQTRKIISNTGGYILSKKSKKRIKNKGLGAYGVMKLIDIAERNDPMLVFGIVLGAFTGTRVGQIVQLSEKRLIGFNNKYATSYYIDFTYDDILRADGKITGNIKKKRELRVFEGHNEIIQIYYKKHMNYLKQIGATNKYGAIFLNKRDGKAMTYKRYLERLSRIAELAVLSIKKDAMNGIEEAIKEEATLQYYNWTITPQSLRYFFTQCLESYGLNRLEIQLYRTDGSEVSQDIYRKGATPEQIRIGTNYIHENILNGLQGGNK